jgi:hypothetical protein
MAGTLQFSDGTTLAVGALPNDGSNYQLDFPTKTITSVTLQINSAQGSNTGLAEFEAYNIPPPPPNRPSQITAGPTANGATITDIQTSNLSVTATDPDGDPLVYTWSATGGSIAGAGATVVYTPPRTTLAAVFRIDVAVSDGRGGNVTGSVNITVNPSGTPFNVARYATVTASSQSTGTGQQASKAIDGVVSGYPADASREWAAVNQTAGAWITLTWSSPQLISRLILHDRINGSDRVMAGTLQFSDGTTLAVGALPNDGSNYQLDFPTKTITSVTLQINSAQGSNTGLAEFEVY